MLFVLPKSLFGMVSEMGFEGSGGSKLLGLRVTPMHKRSKRYLTVGSFNSFC